MVDIKAYVDFDAEAECGIRENVRFDVLCEILDAAHRIINCNNPGRKELFR